MLKRILVASAALAAAMTTPVAASDNEPTSPPPQACGCVWMATGFNPDTGDFSYGWVCETVQHCIPLGDP